MPTKVELIFRSILNKQCGHQIENRFQKEELVFLFPMEKTKFELSNLKSLYFYCILLLVAFHKSTKLTYIVKFFNSFNDAQGIFICLLTMKIEHKIQKSTFKIKHIKIQSHAFLKQCILTQKYMGFAYFHPKSWLYYSKANESCDNMMVIHFLLQQTPQLRPRKKNLKIKWFYKLHKSIVIPTKLM